jgi:chemotaxis protein methyltransferase CheR
MGPPFLPSKMNVDRPTPQLSTGDFEQISSTLYEACGINLSTTKTELVRSRLSRRLAALGLSDFTTYLALVRQDRTGGEMTHFVDVLTTNKTAFFREAPHFDFLKEHVIPELPSGKLRIWSAACSSGEEPYSIAILLREIVPQIDTWDVKILATDISSRVLERARAGTYARVAMEGVPTELRRKYFETAGTTQVYKVREPVKRMVGFARLNLMDEWPMKGLFDVIFCRNVMIYFSKATQLSLVRRMAKFLKPGGHLLIGHAESLTGLDHGFHYVQPAIYKK